ncbi:MAG: hypothetical protein LBI72_03260 [Flavobacteriaceae bacterium]|jgi:hypothetical protein|nr:hypothetical protein [Flavobacteriaceae bacterium]
MKLVTKYEDRLTLYIDLLGFKQILNETEHKIEGDYVDNEEKIKALQEAYLKIYASLDTATIKDKATNKKVTIFSDSIVVSMKPKRPNHLDYLLNSIRKMIIDLANIGILCRGAITYGKLIHTDLYVFGPALVEAYLLESKSANYPRIILEYSILIKLTDLNDRINLRKTYLKKDLDGLYYLDYFDLFSETEEFDKVFNDDNLALEYLKNIKQLISDSLKKYNRYSHVDIRVKYVWMKEKINTTISAMKKTNLNQDIVKHYNLNKPIISK